VTLYPRNLRCQGRATALFAALTRRRKTSSRKILIPRFDHPPPHHPGLQEPADQPQDTSIAHLPRHPRHQHVVIHSIEEPLQIEIHHPALAVADVRLGSAHRLLRVTPRPEAEAPGRERWLKQWLQNLMQRLLHARPAHLQPALELGHRHVIDARRALVPDHPLVRQPHVAAFDHPLHQRAVVDLPTTSGLLEGLRAEPVK